MVQQLDGAPPEGTRNVQERQYRVPFQYFAWKEYHVPDVLPDGDCQDRVDKLSGQQQCRVLGCSRLGRVFGYWSGRDYCRATATPSPFPRYDGCRHEGRWCRTEDTRTTVLGWKVVKGKSRGAHKDKDMMAAQPGLVLAFRIKVAMSRQMPGMNFLTPVSPYIV